jgi:hypothetical protein
VGLGLVATVSTGSGADAAAIVATHAQESMEGNGSNSLPWAPDVRIFSPARTQQVYASSEFKSWDGPQYINQIAFRQDILGFPFKATLPDARIVLSTTSRPVDGLSTTFADNVGQDESVVYQGELPIFSMVDTTGGLPRALDIAVNLQTPFLYDPSRGNLLVDITNPSLVGTTVMDAQEMGGDGTSRVYAYGSDLSRGTADSIGLVTRFQTGGPEGLPQPPLPTTVPEPGSMAVLGLGLVILVARRGRGSRGPGMGVRDLPTRRADRDRSEGGRRASASGRGWRRELGPAR